MTKADKLSELKFIMKKYILLFIVLSSQISFAQGEANVWYFGYNAGLDFNTNPPTALTNGACATSEGSASISDKNGNLLFYTDGITVWNKNHFIMPNGSGLYGNSSSSQSGIIVPYPGTYNSSLSRFDKYYIITVDYLAGSYGVNYSEVDMTLNGGLGDITAIKNINLYDAGAGVGTNECIGIAQHSNGCDFWLIGKPAGNADFNVYLINSSGLNITPIISSPGPIMSSYIGMLKVAPNNQKIAVAHGGGSGYGLFIYNFNNTNGVVSSIIFQDVTLPLIPYGIEFSPDNNILYQTCGPGYGHPNIYQYDLTSGTNALFLSSRTIIGTTSIGYPAGMQFASDGKIYVANYGVAALGVINNPNVLGTGCNFTDQGQPLSNINYGIGLPALVTSFISPKQKIISTYICNTSYNYSVALTSTANVSSVNWLFTPQANPTQTIIATGFANVMNFTNLGTYSIQALVAYTCYTDVVTTTVSVVSNTTSAIITSTNASCFGNNNGLAIVSSGTNSSSYNYAWNTIPMQTTSTATNLSEGFYSVVITPTACTPSGIELVTNGSFESGNIGFTNALTYSTSCALGFYGNSTTPDFYDVEPINTCYGLTDRNGGNSKVLHIVDLFTPNNVIWEQNISVQSNKQYILSLWAYEGVVVQQYQAKGTNFDVYINNVLIKNDTIGGCGTWYNKIYSWNSGSNTNAIIQIKTGSNNFTLGNAGIDPAFDDFSFQECVTGCPLTATVQITAPPAYTISVNSASICLGQQTATLMANGANTYTWSVGLSSITGSMVTGNPLTTSIYTVMGTNTSSCVGTGTSQIMVNTLPIINTSISNTSICIGQQTATLTASGSNSYTWSTTQTGITIASSPTVTTTYTVVGTNANGCYNYTTATVQVNNLPIISATSASICLGQQTATLNASGANTYTWSNNQTGNSITQNPLINTTYSVIGTDANGCYNYTTTIVQVNSLPVITVNSSTICLGQQIATLTASGANTYTWSTNQNTTTIIQSPIVTTTYTVMGTGNNTCFNIATTTVNVLALPNVIAISAAGNTVCPLSTFTLNATGATNYTWSPTPLLSSPNGSLAVFAPTSNTTYTVVGADGICITENTLNIVIANIPTITATSATICSSQSANLNASGGVSYTWSPSGSLNTANGNNVTTSPLSTTVYSISGSSNLGCVGTTTTQVDVMQTPTITINQNPNATINAGETVQLTATSFANSYTWNPTSFLSCATCSNPVASPTVTTVYCILSENATCTNSLCITIKVETPCATNLTLGLPNAFSPNGDGQNDEYCLQGWNECVTSFSILIFDRWGEKVFETSDPNFCWDGTWKGKLLDPAVFVYYTKATFMSGSDFNKKGNITLVK